MYEVEFEYTGLPRMVFHDQLLLFLIEAYKKMFIQEQSLNKYSTPDLPITSTYTPNLIQSNSLHSELNNDSKSPSGLKAIHGMFFNR